MTPIGCRKRRGTLREERRPGSGVPPLRPSASDFLSHEVAALGKPRLERSGGLGLVGQRIVKALKGRSSAPRWGFCDVWFRNPGLRWRNAALAWAPSVLQTSFFASTAAAKRLGWKWQNGHQAGKTLDLVLGDRHRSPARRQRDGSLGRRWLSRVEREGRPRFPTTTALPTN